MHHKLDVTPQHHKGPPPKFDKKIIGYIGLENLKFAKNCHNNRNVRFDLNLQYENAHHKPSELDPKLNDLLQFLLENEKRLNFPLENDLERAKFFCYRGLLTNVSCSPYEQKEPWKILVILSKGSIYLVQRDTEFKKQKKQKETEKDKLMTAWGHKFEHFMVADTPDSKPTPELPLDEGKEFSLVFKTKLNHHTIVYGAEMDGIRCDDERMPLPPAEQGPEAVVQYLSDKEFIELKTNRHIEFSKQEKNFRIFKTKKWWCQSFLVGINTIVCGFRNDAGIVERLQEYQLKELVQMSRSWDPFVCRNFLNSFLTYVKRCLSKEIELKHGRRSLHNLQSLPLITLVLEWEPHKPVQVTNNYDYEADPILTQSFLDNYAKKGLRG